MHLVLVYIFTTLKCTKLRQPGFFDAFVFLLCKKTPHFGKVSVYFVSQNRRNLVFALQKLRKLKLKSYLIRLYVKTWILLESDLLQKYLILGDSTLWLLLKNLTYLILF